MKNKLIYNTTKQNLKQSEFSSAGKFSIIIDKSSVINVITRTLINRLDFVGKRDSFSFLRKYINVRILIHFGRTNVQVKVSVFVYYSERSWKGMSFGKFYCE